MIGCSLTLFPKVKGRIRPFLGVRAVKQKDTKRCPFFRQSLQRKLEDAATKSEIEQVFKFQVQRHAENQGQLRGGAKLTGLDGTDRVA